MCVCVYLCTLKSRIIVSYTIINFEKNFHSIWLNSSLYDYKFIFEIFNSIRTLFGPVQLLKSSLLNGSRFFMKNKLEIACDFVKVSSNCDFCSLLSFPEPTRPSAWDRDERMSVRCFVSAGLACTQLTLRVTCHFKEGQKWQHRIQKSPGYCKQMLWNLNIPVPKQSRS